MLYGHIPFTTIERYAARHGLDGADDFKRFDRILRALDIDDVKRLNEKANRK